MTNLTPLQIVDTKVKRTYNMPASALATLDAASKQTAAPELTGRSHTWLINYAIQQTFAAHSPLPQWQLKALEAYLVALDIQPSEWERLAALPHVNQAYLRQVCAYADVHLLDADQVIAIIEAPLEEVDKAAV